MQLKSRSNYWWVSYNLLLLLYKELEKALTFCLWTTSQIYLICCLYHLYKQSPTAGGFIPCFAQHFSTSLINFWCMVSFGCIKFLQIRNFSITQSKSNLCSTSSFSSQLLRSSLRQVESELYSMIKFMKMRE